MPSAASSRGTVQRSATYAAARALSGRRITAQEGPAIHDVPAAVIGHRADFDIGPGPIRRHGLEEPSDRPAGHAAQSSAEDAHRRNRSKDFQVGRPVKQGGSSQSETAKFIAVQ